MPGVGEGPMSAASNLMHDGNITVAGMARNDNGRRGIHLVEVTLQECREQVRVYSLVPMLIVTDRVVFTLTQPYTQKP